MSVEILENVDHKVMFCNTTMTAFGPVFYSREDVDEFMDWLPIDPRRYDDAELIEKVEEWRELNGSEA